MNLESEFFFSSNNNLSTYPVRGIRRPSSSFYRDWETLQEYEHWILQQVRNGINEGVNNSV